MNTHDKKHKLAILISGQGSNMRALVEYWLRHRDDASSCMSDSAIELVMSNRADATGLQYAADQGLNTDIVDHREFISRELFESKMIEIISQCGATHVLLAGFMRILGKDFVDRYRGRMLNIHPSLLPAYPGLDTHKRAMEAGETHVGASVHFVTPQLDGGPVIVQAKMAIETNDTVLSLSKRILKQEHKIYPMALQWLLDGDVTLSNMTSGTDECLWHGSSLKTPHRLVGEELLID